VAGSQVLDTVWPKGTVLALERDRPVYGEGDTATCWYRLLSGTVRVFRMLADGRRHIGEFVFSGQFFGFEPGRVHIQGAEAVEPATVVAYPLIAIEQRMAQDHHARRVVGNLMVERVAATQQRVLTLGSLNASERLAAFLLEMARRVPGPAGDALVADLPMSRADVADYLGLTVETVSRVFTAMRRQGAIRLATANHVEILDLASLDFASCYVTRRRSARDDEAPLRRCA
jgi:CRP-like cAMP-binding protein